MVREFRGVGWKFPVIFDHTGKIVLSKHEEDIIEAIRIILGTSKGERVMHEDFGCGIHDMVFDVINTTTLSLTEATVREAIITYEPRIELIGVKVTTDKGEIGKLLINVDYRVRSTNNQFNIVYPFYLSEGL